MIVLGIETSCDETAVGIVTHQKEILAHHLSTQSDHQAYGGVVPEIASRSHAKNLPVMITKALQTSGLSLGHIDGIAVTAGPGLMGGLLAGLTFAKALASGLQKPLVALNHLEAHSLVVRLGATVPFPFLLLLLSGGHCQFLWVKAFGAYQLLGRTRDDSIGETFDKVGRMMGFSYPAGPMIEKTAKKGTPSFSFPKPLVKEPGCDFSFSGLKTALFHHLQQHTHTPSFLANTCASFQETVAQILEKRLENALSQCCGPKNSSAKHPSFQHVVVAGGVAANEFLRQRLEQKAQSFQLHVVAPPIDLCTDNGVMVAWAGLERLTQGFSSPLTASPRPKWPLEKTGEWIHGV